MPLGNKHKVKICINSIRNSKFLNYYKSSVIMHQVYFLMHVWRIVWSETCTYLRTAFARRVMHQLALVHKQLA